MPNPPSILSRRDFLQVAATAGAAGLLAGCRPIRQPTPTTPRSPVPTVTPTLTPTAGDIKLIVRGDDMGNSHAANGACIRAYTQGIERSVEVMAPCPWLPEAIALLNENTGLDVGIHLTLTSEWSAMKWRPLTCPSSLVDADGFFFPMVWPNPNMPPRTSLSEASWQLAEVERELRAQIELAKRHIPHVSHLTAHMRFFSLSADLDRLVKSLAREYGLDIDPAAYGVQEVPGGYGEGARTAQDKVAGLVRAIEGLTPGVWLFVDHPGADEAEMRALGHPGYENVAEDRDGVTRAFTDLSVLEALRRRNIELIAYRDLPRLGEAVRPVP
jgi:predicted glycoside hydrolase/deacetylase ChbG (UPF0249 family)